MLFQEDEKDSEKKKKKRGVGGGADLKPGWVALLAQSAHFEKKQEGDWKIVEKE